MNVYEPSIQHTRTFYTILEDDTGEIVDPNGMPIGECSYDMRTIPNDDIDKEYLIVSFLEKTNKDSNSKFLYTESEIDKLKSIVEKMNENEDSAFTIIKFTQYQYTFLNFDTITSED